MNSRTRRRFAAVSLAVSLGLIALPSIGQSDAVRERVSVVAIQVPVHVSAKGEPVHGLTREHFELLDDGKRVEIVGFDVQDLSIEVPLAERPGASGDTPSTTVPAAARRFVMLLFDMTFSRPGSLERAREAALRVVDDGLHETDFLAVAAYSTTGGNRQILNFTTDRLQAKAAILSIGATERARDFVDPLGLTLIEPSTIAPDSSLVATSELGAGSDRTGSQDAGAEHLLRMQREAGRLDRRSREHQVANMTRDLSNLARMLDSVRGRKHIVYLSEGLDDELLFATTDARTQMEQSSAVRRGDLANVDSEQHFGSAARQSQLTGLVDALRRSDCVVHAIDISNTGVAIRDDGRAGNARVTAGGNQGLSTLSSDTGGSYSRNSNEIGKALEGVLRETSLTYVLTFQPRKLVEDGQYHKIKVRLKDAPKGAKLSFRPGYYAPKPYSRQEAQEKKLTVVEHLLAGRDGGAIPTSVLALPFEQEGERAFVPLLLEIDGGALAATAQSNRVALQIFAYAMGADGRIHDLLTKTVGIDVAQAGQPFRDNGLKFYGTLDLMPGDYELRVMVLDPYSGLFHLRVVALNVPAEGTGPELLSPIVPDAPQRWVLARVEPAAGEQPIFPFVMDQQPYLPAVLPAVTAGRDVPLYLLGRNLGNGELNARAQVLDAEGAVVGKATLGTVQAGPTGMPGYVGLATSFRTGDLPAGEYALAVTLSAPAGEVSPVPMAFVVPGG